MLRATVKPSVQPRSVKVLVHAPRSVAKRRSRTQAASTPASAPEPPSSNGDGDGGGNTTNKVRSSAGDSAGGWRIDPMTALAVTALVLAFLALAHGAGSMGPNMVIAADKVSNGMNASAVTFGGSMKASADKVGDAMKESADKIGEAMKTSAESIKDHGKSMEKSASTAGLYKFGTGAFIGGSLIISTVLFKKL